MDLFGIIGMPVLHSKSPQMHHAVFRELGIDAGYLRLAAANGEEGLKLCREIGIRGINATAPFKDIGHLLDHIDPVAQKADALNTVIFDDQGKSHGYNTDVEGVSGPFLAKGILLQGKKALVLGAGGAAKAAILAMQQNGARVVIANRTVEKAESLAGQFGCGHCSLSAGDLSRELEGCSMIVGCLSTGQRVVPKKLLRKDMAVMDAYYATESALIKDAKEAGAIIVDAKEWLLYQGLKAFELFTGKKAPMEAMRKGLFAHSPKKRNIALIGFMGSGKDTISKEICESDGWTRHDMDDEIVRKAGMPIRDIFAKQGEEAFRRMEKEEVCALEGMRSLVVNCGGGAVLDGCNRDTLKRNAVVVWLWATPETIVQRLPEDGSRPLMDVDDPATRVEELLRERVPLYADACDMVIKTDGKAPKEIGQRILYEIDNAFPDIGKD